MFLRYPVAKFPNLQSRLICDELNIFFIFVYLVSMRTIPAEQFLFYLYRVEFYLSTSRQRLYGIYIYFVWSNFDERYKAAKPPGTVSIPTYGGDVIGKTTAHYLCCTYFYYIRYRVTGGRREGGMPKNVRYYYTECIGIEYNGTRVYYNREKLEKNRTRPPHTGGWWARVDSPWR